MPDACVIDTTVLQKANAPITRPSAPGSLFAKRIRLLQAISGGERTVLYSRRLLHEYRQHVQEPRNDFVRAFFEMLADPRGRIAVLNWARWPGRSREKARRCRYPSEDDHVLRTAIHEDPSTIVTEEKRMLRADECIYRAFQVHIASP
jgi:hypothetical protein